MMTGYAGYHYQDENLGVTVIGQEFVKVAKKLGHTKENPFVILELWGIHGIESLHHRHNGFHKGLGNSPLVKVIESSDTMIQPQKMFNAIIDGFTKHPEIKGLYPQTGDANAIVEGLRAVDRLVPEGDPKHVYVITNDVDKVAINALRKGWFHAVGGTESWHQIDIVIKQLLWHTVLGQPLQDGDYRSGKVKLPRKVVLDIPLITKDNIDAKEVQLYGGTIVFTDMPMGRWDLWPVLDTSSIGLPTPALADRMRLKGY
jgi:ABC-type sugar transport system substrate-binding protein